MKEAFEKILERLEEYEYNDLIEHNSELCEHCKRIDCENGMDCNMCIMDKAKEIVQEVEKEYNNGWISCSERLPDKAGYEVLATLENSFGQRRVAIIFTGYGDESFWHCNNKEIDIEVWKVIAWQPLPEPYKEND